MDEDARAIPIDGTRPIATRVLLAGGTGLVGGLLSDRLATDPDIVVDSLVRTPRRPFERKVDFDELVASPACATPADVGISCLGTTLRAAGSPAAFRRVDHDYVVAFARAAKAAGATRFVLVSSVGAGGAGLYLQVKGETEAAVRALGFSRLALVRPSLLLGSRRDRRPAEALAQIAAPVLTPLLRGGLARYAAIDAGAVADAIETLITARTSGTFIHHVPEIRSLPDRGAL